MNAPPTATSIPTSARAGNANAANSSSSTAAVAVNIPKPTIAPVSVRPNDINSKPVFLSDSPKFP